MTTLGQWAGIAETMLAACPGCGSASIGEPVETMGAWRRFMVPYACCASCGLQFQNPMPNADELTEWYASGQYRLSIGKPKKPDDVVLLRQVQRAKWAAAYIFPRAIYVASAFELGGGAGYLCRELESVYHCSVVNVEVDETYAELSRANGVPTAYALPDREFDLAVCMETLEHLCNPAEVLTSFRQALGEKGHLYVQVPFEAPDVVHVLSFTPEALTGVVEAAGFRVLECAVERPIKELSSAVVCWAERRE